MFYGAYELLILILKKVLSSGNLQEWNFAYSSAVHKYNFKDAALFAHKTWNRTMNFHDGGTHKLNDFIIDFIIYRFIFWYFGASILSSQNTHIW